MSSFLKDCEQEQQPVIREQGQNRKDTVALEFRVEGRAVLITCYSPQDQEGHTRH